LLAPGADPNDIRLAWQGGSGLALARSGALQIKTSDGLVTDAPPRSYQRVGGRKVPVQSAFALDRGSAHSFGFSLGRYDRSAPLVIDPSLAFSTYPGGPGPVSGGRARAFPPATSTWPDRPVPRTSLPLSARTTRPTMAPVTRS